MRKRLPLPAYPHKTPEIERLRPFFDGVYHFIQHELPELLTATKVWIVPGTLPPGAETYTTLEVVGAAMGQPVMLGFTAPLPAGALLIGAVSAKDVVTATLANRTGAPLTVPSGTVRACVWAY